MTLSLLPHSPARLLSQTPPLVLRRRDVTFVHGLLLQVDSSGLNNDIMILISDSKSQKRSFCHSLQGDKASCLRIKRK